MDVIQQSDNRLISPIFSTIKFYIRKLGSSYFCLNFYEYFYKLKYVFDLQFLLIELT